ncbi:MAG: biopolymer transporter ExbD [Veillonellaceae bacterium]|nr:biopolymer transporter ExbD [Veillonellaceae bacterium]
MKYRRSSAQSSVHVDMTPMVDVMMLLLIFFMMSTTFIVAQPGFNIIPPQANSGTVQPPEHITVLVNRDGNIALGEKPVSVAELATAVAAKSHTGPLIFIKADKDARHGRIVEVMDAVKRAGAAKIAVAVEPKG